MPDKPEDTAPVLYCINPGHNRVQSMDLHLHGIHEPCPAENFSLPLRTVLQEKFFLCASYICAEVRADCSASFTTLDNLSYSFPDVKEEF